MTRILIVALSVVLGAVGGVLSAHHSHAATYDESQEITMEGTIAQVLLRNPHSFIHLEAEDDEGQVRRWAGEWGSASQLRRAGVGPRTLSVGDKLVITANPGRNPKDFRFAVVVIQRPSDGWTWGEEPEESSRR